MQAVRYLTVPDGSHARGESGVVEDAEPAARVVRSVPRHLGEGGQGERAEAPGRRVSGGVLKQHAADLAAGGARVHGYLLDVHGAAHDVGDQVSDRDTGVIHRDPGAVTPLVAGQLGEGKRLIAGDLRHADIAEPASRCPLDVLHDRQVTLGCCPDMHRRLHLLGRTTGPPTRQRPQDIFSPVISVIHLIYVDKR